jgi:HK97 family phage prohead protease
MTDVMERRDRKADVEYRAADDDAGTGPVAVGHAAVFGRSSLNLAPDWADFTVHEVIDEHAFDRTVREADVVGLWNHDHMHLLGRTKSGTVRLKVDDIGLAYEIDLPDTTTGRDVGELLRRGDVRGSSFGFRTIKDRWEEDEDGNILRTLVEVALVDVSPVTWPAYPDTDSSLRALSAAVGADPLEVRRLVETRSLGAYLLPPEQRDKPGQEPSTDPEPPAPPAPTVGRPRLLSLYA